MSSPLVRDVGGGGGCYNPVYRSSPAANISQHDEEGLHAKLVEYEQSIE